MAGFSITAAHGHLWLQMDPITLSNNLWLEEAKRKEFHHLVEVDDTNLYPVCSSATQM